MKRASLIAIAGLIAASLTVLLEHASADTSGPPMLRYERASAMVNQGRPLVRLDIWADGSARVWFHEMRKTPGEYAFKVAPDRLASLQSVIGELQTSDFDRGAIEKAQASVEKTRRETAAKSGQPVTLFAVSDDTYSRFGINPTGISSQIDALNTISLANLPQMSRRYKSIDALQRWQRIESLALESIQQGQRLAEGVRDERQ